MRKHLPSTRKGRYVGQRTLELLLLGVFVLLLLHMIGQVLHFTLAQDNIFLQELVWRFDVDLELNVPTWYASFLAGLTAVVSLYISSLYRDAKKAKSMRVWRFIGVGFFVIAIDEIASFHELVLQTVHIAAGLGDEQTYLGNAWLLLLPLIVVGAGAALWYAYNNLPKTSAKRFIVAAAVYLLGALVVEYISIPFDRESALYRFILTPLEEGLELLGLWLALRAAVLHGVERLDWKKAADAVDAKK